MPPCGFTTANTKCPWEEDATSESKVETEITLWKSEIPASQVPESKAAGAEFLPDECYISGILTGSTYLKVTDNATQETLTLPIKVVDYYEDLNLIHGSSSLRPNGDENLLPGVDDIFLVNNAARDAYFFKQGQQTALSSGLELITKGTYALKQGEDNKATLTLTFSLDASPATEHHFTVWGNAYLLHRLDKNLHLNWGTPPIGETRTSPAPPPAYTLEEITEGAEPGTGRQVGFILNYKEIPTGILP